MGFHDDDASGWVEVGTNADAGASSRGDAASVVAQRVDQLALRGRRTRTSPPGPGPIPAPVVDKHDLLDFGMPGAEGFNLPHQQRQHRFLVIQRDDERDGLPPVISRAVVLAVERLRHRTEEGERVGG